jgi:hypothetical protein
MSSQREFRRLGWACIGLSLLAATNTVSRAEDGNFTGLPAGGTANWSDAGNWSSGTVPGPGDAAGMIYSDAFDRTVVLDVSASVGTLSIGNLGGGPTTLYQPASVNLTALQENLGAYASSDYGVASGGHIQDGGINNIGSLEVGSYTADPRRVSVGTYVMNAGEINSSYLVIASIGLGTFEQNGGTVTVSPSSYYHGIFYVGQFLQSSGVYRLRAGALTVNGDEYLGSDGAGTFVQTGGTHTMTGVLSLGDLSTSGVSGTYILDGPSATLIANVELMGRHNPGAFTQSAGFHQAQSSVVGYLNRALYDLSAGTFNVVNELDVGLYGWGTFTQSGGAVSVGTASTSNGILLIGAWAGTYNLSSDSASLSVWGNEYLGSRQGTFHQSAGNHFVSGVLTVSGAVHGQYLLDGGSLNVGSSELIGTYYEPSFGSYDPGMFIQTAGSNTTPAMTIGPAGSYKFIDGMLSSATLNIASGGTFLWMDGSLSVNRLDLSGQMTLAAGGAKTLALKSLNINPDGKLNLGDNDMIIDYAADESSSVLLDALRQDLRDGGLFSGFTGAGHRLGYADNALLGLAIFGGQPVDASSILIQYTLAGDANLDTVVDFTDLSDLASNWQSTGVWSGGDFDYDGSVDITDLRLLAADWSGSIESLRDALAQLGLPDVTVPEPAALGLGGLVLLQGARRPRKHTGVQCVMA